MGEIYITSRNGLAVDEEGEVYRFRKYESAVSKCEWLTNYYTDWEFIVCIDNEDATKYVIARKHRRRKHIKPV